MARTSASGIQPAEVQDSVYTYAADAEASDSYAITLSPAPSAYTAGQMFLFKANTANTGAASLNVNGLGAKTIKKHKGEDLADNDIKADSVVSVVYDGTNFQMISMLANAPAGSGDMTKAVYDTNDDGIVNEAAAVEGTGVKSTGEAGGTKFLREDGDGTCSWQAATATVAAADITDATPDGIALITSADANPFTDADESKLDGIEASADVTDTTNVTAAGALMDSEVTNLADVKAFDPADYATAAQGATADSALQDITGESLGDLSNVTENTVGDNEVLQYVTDHWENQTLAEAGIQGVLSEGAFVDGDKTKLDGIEASADVTDETNVLAALSGATTTEVDPASGDKVLILDASDSDNIKHLTYSDFATAAQGSTADSALQNVVDDTTPQLGGDLDTNGNDIVLAENDSIELDASLSADGKYTGITIDGTAGATLAFGDLVYLQAADSRWELADADAAGTAGTVLLGICVLAAASDGSATKILLQGTVRADTAFPSLTIGGAVYAGTTAGDVVTTAPSGADDVVRLLGHGLTADSMYFNPSPTHITHLGS